MGIIRYIFPRFIKRKLLQDKKSNDFGNNEDFVIIDKPHVFKETFALVSPKQKKYILKTLAFNIFIYTLKHAMNYDISIKIAVYIISFLALIIKYKALAYRIIILSRIIT